MVEQNIVITADEVRNSGLKPALAYEFAMRMHYTEAEQRQVISNSLRAKAMDIYVEAGKDENTLRLRHPMRSYARLNLLARIAEHHSNRAGETA